MKFIVSLVLLAGSTLLARCGSILKCDADTTALEVRIAAGQKLKGALVSAYWSNYYPNNICQRWHIMAEENQVHFVLIFVGPRIPYFLVTSPMGFKARVGSLIHTWKHTPVASNTFLGGQWQLTFSSMYL